MIAAAAQDLICRDCTAGHDHCHGGLVLHGDGHAECVADPACAPEPERHSHLVRCAELRPACRCGASDGRSSASKWRNASRGAVSQPPDR